MSTRIMAALTCVVAVLLAVLSGPVGLARASATPTRPNATPIRPTAAHIHTKQACAAAPKPGRAECLALIRTDAAGTALSGNTPLPGGFGPAMLRSAYELASAAVSDGKGMTVALVDAYDDPNAAADLTAYRAEYGLPPCTVASGCFRKVNQNGQAAPLPVPNADWAVEESLDMEMVSAICPLCHIILAEANDNQTQDLAATVATSARLGATQISNSYGAPEYAGEKGLEPFYHHPGVEVTASAGDSGYGVGYPAASAYVTSVGGTALWKSDGGRGWTESVWAGSGSGCSGVIAKPAWQHDACAHRTDNDVAAVADPMTPVAVYDTYAQPGWGMVGGTSVSSPIVAAVDALLGKQAAKYPGGSYWYTHPKNLFGVTSGSNGICFPAYLCTAQHGYSGPAGNGTPDFTGAQSGGSCTGNWSTLPSQPIPGHVPGSPYVSQNVAITALARDDVWTAGYRQAIAGQLRGTKYGILGTLEHWNGKGWTSAPSPLFTTGDGTTTSDYTSLSFDSQSDGWAAGFGSDGRDNPVYGSPMVSHYTGHNWSLSPVLYPPRMMTANGNTSLDEVLAPSITALSPRDVWLGGGYINSLANAWDGSFTEHWDGTAWRAVSLPDQHHIPLVSIKAISADDVWAVGFDPYGSAAWHWNGRGWSAVALPQPSGVLELDSVSGSSSDSVWAVGANKGAAANGGNIPLVYHWDGHSWKNVPIPGVSSISYIGARLVSVTSLSASDAWAAGISWGNGYLVMHWNGQVWSVAGRPNAAFPRGLNAISASSSGNVWTTGDNLPSNYEFLPIVMKHGCGARTGTAVSSRPPGGA